MSSGPPLDIASIGPGGVTLCGGTRRAEQAQRSGNSGIPGDAAAGHTNQKKTGPPPAVIFYLPPRAPHPTIRIGHPTPGPRRR